MNSKEYSESCRLTSFVNPSIKKKVVELSKRMRVSRSEIVNAILEHHLKNREIL